MKSGVSWSIFNFESETKYCSFLIVDLTIIYEWTGLARVRIVEWTSPTKCGVWELHQTSLDKSTRLSKLIFLPYFSMNLMKFFHLILRESKSEGGSARNE